MLKLSTARKLLILLLGLSFSFTALCNLTPCNDDDCEETDENGCPACDTPPPPPPPPCDEGGPGNGPPPPPPPRKPMGGMSLSRGGDRRKPPKCKRPNKGSVAGSGSGNNGSISFHVNFGRPANENVYVIGKFSIFSKKPSPVLFSPTSLQYRNLLLDKFTQDESRASTGASWPDPELMNSTASPDGTAAVVSIPESSAVRQIKLYTKNRKEMIFNFAANTATSRLSGSKAFKNYKLQMVDSSGNTVTSNPVAYRLYRGNGRYVKYSQATGKSEAYTTTSGRTILPDAPSVGLKIVYDATGAVRQVWSAADGLADVVMVTAGVSYEIRIYSPSNVGGLVEGLYTVTGSPHTVWKIENPNPGQSDKVKITKTVGSDVSVYLYEYSYNSEDWKLTKPGDLSVSSKTASWNVSRTVRTETTVVKTPTGEVASKNSRVIQQYSFGDRVVVNINDPDGANLRTLKTYYTDTNSPGSYSRLKSVSNPNGSWVTYQYDSEGRTSAVITPWKNSAFNSSTSAAKAVYSYYNPHDSRDTLTPDDQRPRTEEEKILGITVNKTYHAYYYDSGQYVTITEQCATAGAEYGNSANLRTETRYYAPGDCTSASAGRVYRVTNPDDTCETYTYEYGSWVPNADPAQSAFTAGTGCAVRMSVVYGTTANPNGIANKTTKNITIYDETGSAVKNEFQVYTGSGYESIGWDVYVYDELGRVSNAYSSNNTSNSYTWNCCAKESETLADGTQFTYAYDAMKRLTSKTKVAATGQSDIVTSYTYNAAGARLTTTVSAGGLSLGSSSKYNEAEQLIKSTDQSGLSTTYQYISAVNTGTIKGQTTITTLPGGYTVSNLSYLDGQLKETTGDAVVAEYYDYGVNADGSKWSLVKIGRDDSARWSKTTTDMLGNVIKEEKSGYGGTITTQYFYNTKNQLVKVTSTGKSDILYVYDELGNPIRSGLDINGNGTLDLASTDRIRETEITTVNESGAWWMTKNNKVYATDNDATATVTGTIKERLTGFTGSVVAETKQLDINGNETVQTVAYDSANKTVTRTVNVPESSVDAHAVTVNGLIASRRSPQNLTYTYSYDALGRQTGIIDPRNGTTTTAYYTTGAGKVGQVYTVTDTANNVTTYDYSAATGRVSSVKNALNKYTYYAYNAMGQNTYMWGDTTYPIENIYDNFGQLVQLKTYRSGSNWTASSWPEGSTGTADITTWTYDEASGKVTAKTYSDGRSTTYTYTIDGKVASRTWSRLDNSNPLTTTFNYDANTGQVTGVDYSDSTPDIGYTYNRLGQQKTITDAVGTRTFAYNSALQPVTETITGLYSKTITRDYATTGVVGRNTGFHIGTEYSKSLEYDTYGRLSSLRSPNANSSNDDIFTYAYQTNSNLVNTMTVSNGANTIAVSTTSYENNRNLITQVKNSVSSVVISQYDYVNDAIGRRTSMGKSGTAFAASDTITYGYNDRSEVTSAVSNNVSTYNYGYNFDNIGNRTVARSGVNLVNEDTYVSNNLNQYTSVNSASSVVNPTYNDDGCMLTNGDWTYEWNAENRLIVAEKPDQKLEFKYDYKGRRVEKKVYSWGDSSWQLCTLLRFVYDGYKCIEVLNGVVNNNILKTFCWQPKMLGSEVPLSVHDVEVSKKYYYFADANKNIGQLIDSSGNTVAKYEYSPFGRLVSSNGAYASTNPFRFSSEYHDDETSLVYYNFRYYSPELGRWLSRDPIGEISGHNIYEIGHNDIINFTDFLGLWDSATQKYYDDYLAANPGMTEEQKKYVKRVLGRGCVGIVTLAIGEEVSWDKNPFLRRKPKLDRCFSNIGDAKANAATTPCCPGSRGGKPVLFGIKIPRHSGVIHGPSGKLDMSGWTDQPETDPSTGKKTTGIFDFGIINKDGSITVANHSEPGMKMKTKASLSAWDYSNLPVTVYCVGCSKNKGGIPIRPKATPAQRAYDSKNGL